MKSYLLTIINYLKILLFISLTGSAFAQTFVGDFTGPVFDECVGAPQEINVSVSGIGNLGVDNLGITQVFIDIDVFDGYFVDVVLEAPDGSEFVMAASTSGSFPGWSGGICAVRYIPCPSLPTPQDTWSSLYYVESQPEDDFGSLNDDGINADGIWKIKICNDNFQASYFSEVFYSEIVFGNICPSVTSVVLNGSAPECPGSEAQIDIVVEDGICAASTVYANDLSNSTSANVEAINLWIETGENNIFVEDDYGCTSPAYNFLLEATDSEFPVFVECPTSFDVFFDENCEAEWEIIDPTFMDNCDVSGLVTLIDPDGTLFGPYGLIPGSSFPYSWSNTPGYYTYNWSIEDGNGNETTCQTVVSVMDGIAPSFTGDLNITLIGECGVDDAAQMILDEEANLSVTDNCPNLENWIEKLDNAYELNICGGANSLTEWYQTGNENGPFPDVVSSSYKSITVELLDTQAPIISGIPSEPIMYDCGDDFLPNIPAIGVDIFADDACEGDVTFGLIETISIVANDCSDGSGIIETETHSFIIEDACGNIAEASYEVIITDQLQPVWLAPFDLPMLVTGECGVDDLQEIIDSYIPSAGTCNGEVVGSESGSFFDAECDGSSSGLTTIEYQAESACGVIGFTSLSIELVDTQAPILSGQIADVVIQCGDEFPDPPVLMSMDACNGDVSDLIEFTITSSTDDCDANIVEVYTYTYTASDYCGNAVSYNWNVSIENNFSIDLGEDIVLCDVPDYEITAEAGTSYLWSTGETTQSITVNTTDNYSVVVYSENGCCAEDNINVNFETAPDLTAEGGTLDCQGGAITLSANSTSDVTYSWQGPGGFSSNEQNPIVSQAGTYTVTAETLDGCTASAQVEVLTDTNVPDLTTVGGVIDCNNAETSLSASSDTEGVTYTWTGPNGFTSDESTISVDEAGIYTVTIMAPNGCVATGLAVASEDLTIPVVIAEGGMLNCANESTTISVSSPDEGVTFEWEGPNGFSSEESSPIVSEAGDYTATAIGQNGCMNSVMVQVSFDGEGPDLTATGGLLNCENNVITISANSTDENVNYMWTGPDDFEAAIANPQVNTAGSYTVVATGTNGCTSMMTVEVTADDDLPVISLTGGVIDCNNSTVIINVEINNEDVIYAWSGPNNFTSDDKNIEVAEPGVYTIEVTSTNGCNANTFIVIEEDFNSPIPVVFDGQINCAQPTTNLQGSVEGENINIMWTGPNGFTSSELTPEVSEGGMYVLTVTGQNGCSGVASLTIEEDFEFPEVEITGGTLDCQNEFIVISASADVEVSYLWSGPSSFTSSEPNPTVVEAGFYTVEATSANGCVSVATVEVFSDVVTPEIFATGGTLDCNNAVINLSVTSDDDVSVMWTGPNGFISIDPNPLVQNAGEYTVVATAANGCSVTSTVEVLADFNDPVFDLEASIIDCFDNLGDITLTNPPNGSSFEWNGPEGFESFDQNIQAGVAGIYTVIVTGPNGCQATQSTLLENPPTIEVSFENTPASPAGFDGTSNITVIEGDGPFDFEWEDGQQGSFAEGLNEGRIEVYVTDVHGCTSTFETVIETISSNQHLTIVNSFKAYPNPATNHITVDLQSSEYFEGTLNVFNYQGQLVHKQTINQTDSITETIDISMIPAGNYLLQIIGPNIKASKQISIIK